MTHYPVFLDLRGRRCVVLGDNAVAREKVAVLIASGAVVDHHLRPHRDGDLAGAYLAIDASGDPVSNEAARAEAECHRVLLNVVDVAAMCDWIAPAVVRRGPLQIAISTGGESPFLAATIREQLEKLFGEEWEAFAQVVGTVRRRLRRRSVGPDRQRRAYKRLLQSSVRRLLRDGRYTEAADLAAAIEHAAATGEGDQETGDVILVGAGPGDAGLITVAGREALQCADVVFHDALVDQGVLELCARDVRLVNVGKRAGRPSMPQGEINAMLIAAARAGQFVVRLKGGDPLLFARGGEEIAALLDAGVAVRVIPGVSSALAAAASAGIPLTHRGVAASVAITTGQQASAGADRLSGLAASADTLVVLMPSDLDGITRRIAAVVGAGRPAALVSAATLPGQRLVSGPIGELAALARVSAAGDAPRTLIVGEVVRLALDAAAAQAAAPGQSFESFQP